MIATGSKQYNKNTTYWFVTECSVHQAGLYIYKMYKINFITLLHVMQANRKVYNQTHHHTQTTSLIDSLCKTVSSSIHVFILHTLVTWCLLNYFFMILQTKFNTTHIQGDLEWTCSLANCL